MFKTFLVYPFLTVFGTCIKYIVFCSKYNLTKYICVSGLHSLWNINLSNAHFVITGGWCDRICLDFVTDEKQSDAPHWGLNPRPKVLKASIKPTEPRGYPPWLGGLDSYLYHRDITTFFPYQKPIEVKQKRPM